MPTIATAEVSVDCWINEMEIVNDGAGSATVSVYDRQGTPVALFPSNTLPKGGMLSVNSDRGRYMPGGFTWSASATGVVGWMVGFSS